MHWCIFQHYLAIGRRFLDAIMLWSNPDRAWIDASLEYLRNLCGFLSRVWLFTCLKHPAAIQKRNVTRVKKFGRSLNPRLSLPAHPPRSMHQWQHRLPGDASIMQLLQPRSVWHRLRRLGWLWGRLQPLMLAQGVLQPARKNENFVFTMCEKRSNQHTRSCGLIELAASGGKQLCKNYKRDWSLWAILCNLLVPTATDLTTSNAASCMGGGG